MNQTTATVQMKLELPTLPNFIRVVGMKDHSIPVGDLDPEVVKTLAQDLARAFVEHCKTKREMPQIMPA